MANDKNLRKVMEAIPNTIHFDQGIMGINIIKRMTINNKSAILSKVAPNGLLHPIFLAIYPSKASLIPHRR
ncbi:hypothetical protein SDC9_211924 [bioreactor metagenome]|uniref:Uncharacterized protein n=1 Tax=bioreactor metagenome TaxID=1076179 RepID=A0A645JYI2_9ZZZZ